ncbi:MAG: flippase-like domain-containing protein [Bacteroidales bacterium]|nr:flippase-like domain-containing protein [Candidatus Latescibacterota bacterium]
MRTVFQIAGIALFIVILSKVDLRSVRDSFSDLSIIHMAGTVLILLSFTLVKAMRWRTIVKMQGGEVTPVRAFAIYSSALYMGFLTPGRLGDFIKSIYLMRSGMSVGKAVYSSVADRLFDLGFLAVIGFASLVSFPGIFNNQIIFSGVLLVSVAAVFVVLFWRRDLLKRIAGKFLSGAPKGSFRGNIDKIIEETVGEFSTLKPSGLAQVILLSAIAWVLHFGVFILLADGIGTGASVHVLIVSVAVAIFTALIPVSLSGLGTRELVLVMVFSRVGLSKEAAVTFSLSFILVYLIQGVTGLVCWLVAPLEKKMEDVKDE